MHEILGVKVFHSNTLKVFVRMDTKGGGAVVVV